MVFPAKLSEGQEFFVETFWDPPEGFCTWAWADIRHYVNMAYHGGKSHRSNPGNVFITCCSDGCRPVIFKVEGIE